MVIGVIGENCSGKSTLAEALAKRLHAEIVTGKDYLRLAKSESEAEALFRAKLESAMRGDDIIYVISEKAQLELLPKGAVRVLVSADLETIKERFRKRMRGNLTAPVERMLEIKHGMFDGGVYDYRYDGASGDAPALCAELEARRAQTV